MLYLAALTLAFENLSDLLPFNILLELKADDYHKNVPRAKVLLFLV